MVIDRTPHLDRVFQALANPSRRAMLRRLCAGPRSLGELAAPFRMSFPAASKHVRVLERARLVRRKVVGRTHLCSIAGQPLAEVNRWLESYRQVWEESFQRLDTVLDELKARDSRRGRA